MGRWITSTYRLRLNGTAIQIRHAVGASAVSIAVVMAGSAAINANGEERCTSARVGIRFGLTPDTDAGLTTDLVHEMAAVWKPNDIEIVQYTDGPTSDSQMAVAIVLTSTLPPFATRGVLGWTTFVDGRVPLPVIYLSVPATRALLATGRFLGVPMPEVPRPVHSLLVARALGRAAAHELGHYLLGSTQHGATGLMRLSFTVDQLIDNRRQPFRLQHPDRLALTARMREMAPSCASAISESTAGPEL
jgi:hypothetical protein